MKWCLVVCVCCVCVWACVYGRVCMGVCIYPRTCGLSAAEEEGTAVGLGMVMAASDHAMGLKLPMVSEVTRSSSTLLDPPQGERR